MTVYRGVVRGNTVVLDEPVGLTDGSLVEVRPVDPPPPDTDELEREDAFKRSLIERGLLRTVPSRLPDPPDLDRTLLDVEGPPVSHTLIEERR